MGKIAKLCVALVMGCAAVAVAGPTEDLVFSVQRQTQAPRGDAVAVRALLRKGANVNARSSGNGETVLMIAAGSPGDHLDVVQALLDKGADVNARTKDGTTALMMAANREVAKALLNKGAEVNARNSDGRTALMMAAGSPGDHLDVVQALLDKGADVNAGDNNGTAPLTFAAWHGRKDVVQALLDKGADVNARRKDGSTALMMAAVQGYTEVIEWLGLPKGEMAPPPAALPERPGYREVVQTLLNKGADVNARNSYGWTALTMTRDAQVRALLVQAGAKP